MEEDAYTFLLVDDSEEDSILVRLAFTRAKIPNPIKSVASGEDAIAYLNGSGAYSDRQKCPLPMLVFLDLNLPGISGLQVLGWLRGQPHLRHVRAIVLTSSPDVALYSKVRELGADHLFIKTHDYKDLVSYVQSFGKLLHLVQPPPATGISPPAIHG